MPKLSKAHEQLVRRLQAIHVLQTEDVAALADLPLRFKDVPQNNDLVREGDQPSESCLIVEGFACRYKILREGQRQIFSFHIPGDLPDLQSLHIETMDHNLGAITPCRVAYIPHASLSHAMQTRPNLASAFWRDTLVDAAVFREWLAGVGRRSAYQRIAHLICEVFTRLSSVGLAEGSEFTMPTTQVEIADSLGLSNVHVNRTLQRLRAQRLIITRGTNWVISDWDALRLAGEFDAAYLHLKSRAA